MSTSPLRVWYGPHKVGTLAVARGGIFFEYAKDFIESGHELSPLHLPLGLGVRARDTVPTMRLPGLFEDSLPDQWGRRLMDAHFRKHGISAHDITPLMMLAYVGSRGMGALTYEPEHEASARDAEAVERGASLSRLHQFAEQMERGLVAETSAENAKIDLETLARVGSSAGGARPKALIGLPSAATASSGTGIGQVILGGEDLPEGHDAWIVKFDTSVSGSVGPLEEAYARMARAAGIDFPETRLLETHDENGRARRHFAVKRFDRQGTEGRERVHFHSLAGMCQITGGDLDYVTFLRVTRRITHDEREVWRAWRRAVFNVLASNRDDHGKNHAFVYHDRDRSWHLAPAYDVTFVAAAQLPERGMAIVGERRAAGESHLLSLAKAEGLDMRVAAQIIAEVRDAIARWSQFANEAGVPAIQADDVARELKRIEVANSH